MSAYFSRVTLYTIKSKRGYYLNNLRANRPTKSLDEAAAWVLRYNAERWCELYQEREPSQGWRLVEVIETGVY